MQYHVGVDGQIDSKEDDNEITAMVVLDSDEDDYGIQSKWFIFYL